MKIDGGRTFIDKPEVARRLIHAAIRATLQGECPISVHVAVQSAITLMQEYAKNKGIVLVFDIAAQAKPEFQKGLRDSFKSFYNFMKHGDNDADASIDVTNLTRFNDILILTASFEYHNIFKKTSMQMGLFQMVMFLLHPGILDPGAMQERPEWAEFKKAYEGWGRDEILGDADRMMHQADFQEELSTDKTQLIGEGEGAYYAGNPHRDMFKKIL